MANIDPINWTLELLNKNPNKPFTRREIANWFYRAYKSQCDEWRNDDPKRAKSYKEDNALVGHFVARIRINEIEDCEPRVHLIKKEGKPATLIFKKRKNGRNINFKKERKKSSTSKEKQSRKNSQKSEHELYPLIREYLLKELNLYSKRIPEKESSNKGGANGNKWLYPDIVAVELLNTNWDNAVKAVVHASSDKKAKLWSFEVKREIKNSSVRQDFFQTVSNSSWANFGYLVAPNINKKEKYFEELLILSRLHGIGLIEFDSEGEEKVNILIQAQERSNVDWHTANRLAEVNARFRDYLNKIATFYKLSADKEANEGFKNWKTED